MYITGFDKALYYFGIFVFCALLAVTVVSLICMVLYFADIADQKKESRMQKAHSSGKKGYKKYEFSIPQEKINVKGENCKNEI